MRIDASESEVAVRQVRQQFGGLRGRDTMIGHGKEKLLQPPPGRHGPSLRGATYGANRPATLGTVRRHYDLVVLGGGPASERGAAQAAYFGKRVAIVERQPTPGGAAVHTGTLPSKTLRETALFLSGYRQRALYGVKVDVDPVPGETNTTNNTAEYPVIFTL